MALCLCKALNYTIPRHESVRFTFGVMDNPTDYIEIFSGYMDQMNIDEGPDTTHYHSDCGKQVGSLRNVLLVLVTLLLTRKRSILMPMALATQTKGLDFVVGLQTKKIIWGAIP